MKREVLPEILDHLEAGDPRAIRSRRDLRLINFLMGNHRWLQAQLKELRKKGVSKVVEIGAGDGHFSNKLVEQGFKVQAIDLAPPFKGLNGNVIWNQGDVFDLLGDVQGDVVIANLFLHHFEAPELQRLGILLKQYPYVLCCEPLRWNVAHIFGKMLHPFINDVTKHDMHVSIDAGFAEKELIQLLGLEEGAEFSESLSCLGGVRLMVGNSVSSDL